MFAEGAARRLAATVQAGELSPTQMREVAEQLGQEGGRWEQMDAITDERLRRDMQQAQSGDLSGLQELFRDAATHSQAVLLRSAMRMIERGGTDPQTVYLKAATPGQMYDGTLHDKSSRVALVASANHQMLAITPANVKGVQVGEVVHFTAQLQQGMELDY